jgi:hypothetical protein
MHMHKLLPVIVVAVLLASCSTRGPHVGEPIDQAAWHGVPLPGKKATRYVSDTKDGRRAIRAEADSSASLWRRKVDVPTENLADVSWSWWVESSIPDADLTDADRADAPARVVLAFEGDRSQLPPRTRMMFELARTLTGEEPPYATLMYVHAQGVPAGTVLVSQRSDRIRKIVVDGGPSSTKQWRQHRRNIVADYQLAFGKPPGRLVGIGVMTDGDNTRSKARAWYGPIELSP